MMNNNQKLKKIRLNKISFKMRKWKWKKKTMTLINPMRTMTCLNYRDPFHPMSIMENIKQRDRKDS